MNIVQPQASQSALVLVKESLMALSPSDVLTAALVVITGAYVVITSRILKANQNAVRAMRDQVEAATRPYITIVPFLYPNSWLFRLRIANTGKSAANNLRFTIDRDFFRLARPGQENNLASFPAFRETISSFAPGAQFTFMLAPGPEMFKPDAKPEITPPIFTITASYDYSGKRVVEPTTIDLTPWKNADVPTDPMVTGLVKIAEAIEKRR